MGAKNESESHSDGEVIKVLTHKCMASEERKDFVMAPLILKLQSSSWFLCRCYGEQSQSCVYALTGFVQQHSAFLTRKQRILTETVPCQKLSC